MTYGWLGDGFDPRACGHGKSVAKRACEICCPKGSADDAPNFRSNGKLYLVRCPECGRENHGVHVAAGECVWCGWTEDDSPLQEDGA